MLLQHEGVVTHQRVASESEEDPGSRETHADRQQGHDRISERLPGRAPDREDRPREFADQPEQADPQAESRQEPTPTDTPPGEVQSAEEDENAAEDRREAEDREPNHHDQNGRIVEIRGNKIPVHRGDVDFRAVNKLPREEARGGKHGQDHGVPVANLTQAPPRRLLLHGWRPTRRRILMAFRVDIEGPWHARQHLSSAGPIETARTCSVSNVGRRVPFTKASARSASGKSIRSSNQSNSSTSRDANPADPIASAPDGPRWTASWRSRKSFARRCRPSRPTSASASPRSQGTRTPTT